MEALYIHIPFCSAICTYCDFAKEMAKPEKKIKYIEALCTEINTFKDDYKNLETLYIGGGTPSSLTHDQLEKLLGTLSNVIEINTLDEFTVECNPNDVTKALAELFKRYGVNRISLGVQTFNERHLKALNREHTNADVMNAIALFKAAGIDNISLDLIFSLPNQTMEELEDDLTMLKTLDMPHISFYSLILEEKTVLDYRVKKGTTEVNDEDVEAAMYIMVMDTLKSYGYEHYEISNFTKGMPSLHNKMYWLNKDYLGLGAAAHGKVKQKRYFNAYRVNHYIDHVELHGHGSTTEYPYEAMRDTMLMGLRLLEGINLDLFETQFKRTVFAAYPKLHDFIDQGLLEQTQTHLKFTRKGLLLGNIVFSCF